jgi:uncharacterized membrane protein
VRIWAGDYKEAATRLQNGVKAKSFEKYYRLKLRLTSMKHHLQDIAKKRFNKELEELPEREQRVIEHFNDRLPISHDTNQEFETEMTFGQKLADNVAKFGGSWTFIIIFGLILLSWVLLNSLLLAMRGAAFDHYPYILLNLFFRCSLPFKPR